MIATNNLVHNKTQQKLSHCFTCKPPKNRRNKYDIFRERERQRERQTVRKTDRQTERERDRQRQRERDLWIEKDTAR